MTEKNFIKRTGTIHRLASAVKAVCVQAQLDGGQVIQNINARNESMLGAAQSNFLFESIDEGSLPGLVTAWGSSIDAYANTHGHLPSDEVLASAASSLINGSAGAKGENGALMFESLDTALATNSDGVLTRARMQGLILPTLLQASTSDMVTHIPAGNDEAEIFELKRIAGSNFGDFSAGDEISTGQTGQYGNMLQIFKSPSQPDGTLKSFTFNTDTHTKAKSPIKKHTATIYMDNKPVAKDEMGSGKLISVGNAVGINFVGTIDYSNGIIVTTTDVAPENGKTLYIEFEIDIEKAPNLVPSVNLDMDSFTLRPHQSVIGSDYTLQSFWKMKREYGVDLSSQLMANQRNLLAYEKDVQNIRKAIFAAFANPITTHSLTISANHTWRDEYSRISEVVSKVSSEMLKDTEKSGIVGMYCGIDAVNVFKALGDPLFKVAPNYREVNRIHYVGMLAGRFKIYAVPGGVKVGDAELTSWDCLAYGRGENHSEAGIVNGDAIAPVLVPQGFNGFTNGNVLWTSRYQDIHPSNGHKYFRLIRFTPPA